MPILKEINKDRIQDVVPQESNDILKIKEPKYALSGSAKVEKTSSLVELEIAFRRCKSGGVFDD